MVKAAVVAATVLGVMFVAACGSGPQTREGGNGVVSGVSTSDHDGYAGALLTEPYVVPDVNLTATDGSRFSLAKDTEGKLTVLFFGYTQCPDVCQVVMGTIASAYARLDKVARAKVQVIFATTDPARDTTRVLRSYLDRLNPRFIGLTGDISDLDAAGKPLGVFVKKGSKLPSGGYDVSHTTSVIAIGGKGKAPLVWSATTSPAQMAADIDKLLKKKV
ncbi:MAG: SCO family protein [Marmoricola sp.]